jgi:hypothetical protein
MMLQSRGYGFRVCSPSMTMLFSCLSWPGLTPGSYTVRVTL